EHPAVRAQHVHDCEGGHDDRRRDNDSECNHAPGGSIETRCPSDDARPWVSASSRDEEECESDQRAVTGEGLPPNRLRVEPSKAVALGSLPTRHREPHRSAERKQQSERNDAGSPPRGAREKQQSESQLGERKTESDPSG